MRALDTNVLVRYLVRDDQEQFEQASSLIDRAVSGDERLFVPDVVLAELVWVLRGSYRASKERILEVLDALYRARHLSFRSAERVARAIARFKEGNADFADYLLWEQASDADCETLLTFDEKLLREQGSAAP